MRPSFVRDVERTLVPGGSLHFWTDVREYFETTLALLAADTTLGGPLPVAEAPAEYDMAYRTHFERRVRLAEEPVYRAEFRKVVEKGKTYPVTEVEIGGRGRVGR